MYDPSLQYFSMSLILPLYVSPMFGLAWLQVMAPVSFAALGFWTNRKNGHSFRSFLIPTIPLDNYISICLGSVGMSEEQIGLNYEQTVLNQNKIAVLEERVTQLEHMIVELSNTGNPMDLAELGQMIRDNEEGYNDRWSWWVIERPDNT